MYPESKCTRYQGFTSKLHTLNHTMKHAVYLLPVRENFNDGERHFYATYDVIFP